MARTSKNFRDRSSQDSKIAIAAGGVVYRQGDIGSEIVLVARRKERLWALPKGTLEENETIEEAALREVLEETGLVTVIVDSLGTVDYSFMTSRGDRIDKTVHHFLLEPIGGSFDNHDDEFDHVGWYDIHDAQRRLTHRNQLHILDRVEKLILPTRQNS